MDFSIMSDPSILAELGARVQRHRLNRNITQDDLAAHAGVSRTVVQRLEQGRGCTLKGFVRILRALDMLPQLAVFLPDPGPSPLQLARLAGRARQRAAGSRRGPATTKE
jgi:DNA-binding XRE family transcriptional regulator